MSKLNTGWFLNVPDEKKKEVEDTIKHSTIPLRQLALFIKHQIELLDQTKMDEDYLSASWPYKQADRLGQLRAYRKLLTLVDNK